MTALKVQDLLLASRLDTPQVAALLGPFGLKDPLKADANLQAIAGDPNERQLLAEILEELLVCISLSADPDQAMTYFERFSSAAHNKAHLFTYLKNSPQALEILAKSLGGSAYMAEILIRDPHLFYWVTDPQILNRHRSKREIQRELLPTLKVLGDERTQLDYLRSIKRREMLHVGVRDLLRLSSVEDTWTALSVLAEALISAAYWICASALRREYEIPARSFTGFTILAMGKLGGGELNFSSDVDLMYVYSSDDSPGDSSGGQPAVSISASEYFRRLSRKITSGLNAFTGEGYLYRVDLRLRPEGEAGSIANPLDEFERYYQSRMGTWERLALLKVWPVAGNRALANAFLRMSRPYVYEGPFDLKTLDDIRDMKRRIDQKIASRQQGGHNVKLGTGGIREIELIAQSLQVSHGARLPDLCERNTVRALRSLRDQSLLSDEEYASLEKAYSFLRDVENKLQMVHDAQTHWLPLGQDELLTCVRLLGYSGPDFSPIERFQHDYEHHTRQVNQAFEAIVGARDLRRFIPACK